MLGILSISRKVRSIPRNGNILESSLTDLCLQILKWIREIKGIRRKTISPGAQETLTHLPFPLPSPVRPAPPSPVGSDHRTVIIVLATQCYHPRKVCSEPTNSFNPHNNPMRFSYFPAEETEPLGGLLIHSLTGPPGMQKRRCGHCLRKPAISETKSRLG